MLVLLACPAISQLQEGVDDVRPRSSPDVCCCE